MILESNSISSCQDMACQMASVVGWFDYLVRLRVNRMGMQFVQQVIKQFAKQLNSFFVREGSLLMNLIRYSLWKNI